MLYRRAASAVCISFLLMFFFGCKSIPIDQKPKASLEDLRVTAISLADMTVRLDIGITNPLPVGLKLAGIDVKTSINKKQLFKATTAKGFRLKAAGKAVTAYSFKLRYRDLYRIARDYSRRSSLDCTIDLVVRIPIPGNIPGVPPSVAIPISVKRKIPTVKPHIEIKNLAVKKMKINPLKMDVTLPIEYDIILTNRTPAKISFQKLTYGLKLNARSVASATSSGLQPYKNGSKLHVSTLLSSRKIGRSLLGVIQKKRARYTIGGSAAIKLPGNLTRNALPLKFSQSGSFR